MPTGKRKNVLNFVLYVGLCLLLPHSLVHGDTSADDKWEVLDTKYTRIHYQSWDDLKKFNRNIDYSPGSWGLKRLLGLSGSDTSMDELPQKVDALYERVQEILDMRRRMEKVNINVYQNKKQLHAAYFEIFKVRCLLRAWYIHEHNTIYLNIDDVHEGIVAHEMAHCIIDHYLLIRPPKATAEILARYVDEHLFE